MQRAIQVVAEGWQSQEFGTKDMWGCMGLGLSFQGSWCLCACTKQFWKAMFHLTDYLVFMRNRENYPGY